MTTSTFTGTNLMLEKRFDRIEAKLDQVVDTLAELARIDERLNSSHKRLDRHEVRLDHNDKAQRLAAEKLATYGSRGMMVERAAWVVFAALITMVVKFL